MEKTKQWGWSPQWRRCCRGQSRENTLHPHKERQNLPGQQSRTDSDVETGPRGSVLLLLDLLLGFAEH